MANWVEDQEGTESKVAAVSEPIAISELQQWMRTNRLTRFGPYFEREEVVLSDLIHYTDQTIEFRDLSVLTILHRLSYIIASVICVRSILQDPFVQAMQLGEASKDVEF